MMRKTILHSLLKKVLLLSVLTLCLYALPSAAQNWGSGYAYTPGGSGSGSGCQKKDCSNSTCQMATDSSGKLLNECPSGKVKRQDVDPNCVMNLNAGAGTCMDTMPAASVSRVPETNCYRGEGWSRKRNHLGTDYAASTGTIITAAADGTVVYAKPMNGGGRALAIEHTKKCQCTAGGGGGGCDNKYVTVYLHLSAYIVTGGPVKKGQPVGYVGGSNYKNGVLYDPPHADAYSPHLHFEIHSGGWNKGYNTLKTSIINPLCDDIQSFCGGCSYNVEEQCTGKKNSSEWTSLSEQAKQDKKPSSTPPPVSDPGGYSSSDPFSSAEGTSCDYQNFMPEPDTCYFCPLFKVLFNTASELAQKTYNALKDGIAAVVVVCFALWIALFVLRQISSLEAKKPGKMIQEILIQTFRVLFVVVVLKLGYAQILKLTITPIFDSGMAYAQLVSGAHTCSGSYIEGISGYKDELNPDSKGALPQSMGQNILCAIKAMQDSAWRIVAFGRECRCVGWKPKAIIPHIIPRFSYLLTGDFLIVAGLLLVLAFPWCLVDCMLNMAIAIALLPAAIGAWAFPSQKGYLDTLFKFFLNAVFQFVFLSIILYIIMTCVEQFLGVIDSYSKDYDKILDPIHGIAFWGANGMKLIMVCLLGWVFLDQGKQLADDFASAPSLGIGRKTGGLFAQIGERLALGGKGKDGKRHGGALGLTREVGNVAGMSAKYFVGTPLRQRMDANRNERIRRTGTAIKDENGNIIGYETDRNILGSRNLLGQKVTKRVMLGEDGQMIYSEEKEGLGTQFRNAVRSGTNELRVDLIEKEDAKVLAMFDGPTPEGMKSGTSKDGARELFDRDGNLVARKRVLEDGKIELTSKHGVSVYDGTTLISTTQTYRNMIGEKVTMTANLVNGQYQLNRATQSLRMAALGAVAKDGSKLQTFAQGHAVKKDHELGARLTTDTKVTEDHLLSIRDVKDESGKIVQQDFAFNTKLVKYLVDQEGHLNNNMINEITRGSSLPKEEVQLAIALEVMKTRKMNISNKFKDRQVVLENGNLTVVQKNLDGSTTSFTAKIDGNQMVVDLQNVDSKGNLRRVTDNGIMKRNITQAVNKQAVAEYGFNENLYQKWSYHKFIDERGAFAQTIDNVEAMRGFEEYDRDLHAKQVKNQKTQFFETSQLRPLPTDLTKKG